MDETTKRLIEDLFRLIINSHYPDLRADGATLAGVPSALDSAMSDTADLLTFEYQMLCTDGIRPSMFLASVGAHSLKLSHKFLCGIKRKSARHFCRKDLSMMSDLLQAVGVGMCASELERRLDGSREYASYSKLDEAQLIDALEKDIHNILRPHKGARDLLPLDSNRPNVQINGPLSGPEVTMASYTENRRLAKRIDDEVLEPKYTGELTSDYVSPESTLIYPVDESLSVGALFRASALIFFGDGSGRGTGYAIGMADALLIPVLILWKKRDNESPDGKSSRIPFAKRFPGTMSRHSEAYYSDENHALELVRAFLAEKEVLIFNRSAALAKAERSSIRLIQEAVMSMDPALFEHSYLSHGYALFMTKSAVNFYQAGWFARVELLRLTGLSSHETKATMTPRPEPRTSSNGQSLTGRSIRSLHAFARIKNLSIADMTALIEVYFSEVNRSPVSARQDEVAVSFEDWSRLYRRIEGIE